MKRHIPPEFWDGFVFHATELFNGGGKVFKRTRSDFIGPPQWPLDRRLEIADEIMAIPKKFALEITYGFIERATFKDHFHFPDTTLGQITIAQQVAAFSTASIFIERWMRKNASGENCVLVVENNDRAKALMRDMHQWHQGNKVA